MRVPGGQRGAESDRYALGAQPHLSLQTVDDISAGLNAELQGIAA